MTCALPQLQELANYAEERGITEKDILPRMDEWEVFPREAVACALKSIEQGVARVKPSRARIIRARFRHYSKCKAIY